MRKSQEQDRREVAREAVEETSLPNERTGAGERGAGGASDHPSSQAQG